MPVCRDRMPARKPANSRLSGGNRRTAGSVGLRGGAIRTRTMDPLGWVCEICAKKSRLPDRSTLSRPGTAGEAETERQCARQVSSLRNSGRGYSIGIEGLPALRPLGAWMRERCDFRRNDAGAWHRPHSSLRRVRGDAGQHHRLLEFGDRYSEARFRGGGAGCDTRVGNPPFFDPLCCRGT